MILWAVKWVAEMGVQMVALWEIMSVDLWAYLKVEPMVEQLAARMVSMLDD